MIFDSYSQTESYYHALLSDCKKVNGSDISKLKAGTRTGDKILRSLLVEYNSLESIFLKYENDIIRDEEFEHRLQKRISKFKQPFSLTYINDSDFPLKEFDKAPGVLYYSGDLSILEENVMGVVGTRRSDLISEQTRNNTQTLFKRLALRKYNILSGLAEECDTRAHELAIENNLKTIAVIGTPLDKYYPKENKELQKKIADEHLLITQFPIGIKTWPSHFAHRDYVQASLSDSGLIVIHAPNDSGTKHAVKTTLEQNKRVFYLPGNSKYTWPSDMNKKYPNMLKKIE